MTIRLFKDDLIRGSIDEELLKRAIDAQLTLGGLESFEEQIRIMESLKEKHLEKQLIDVLERPEKHLKDNNRLLDWYLKGRTRKMFNYASRQMKGNTKVLIDNRNKIMASRIVKIINTQDKNFFSFGAGHLNGPHGIIKLLRKEGIIVTKEF